MAARLGDLVEDDAWDRVYERFSAPRVRLGRPWGIENLCFESTWTDPAGRATYVVKAQQANGHLAWSSPILFEDD